MVGDRSNLGQVAGLWDAAAVGFHLCPDWWLSPPSQVSSLKELTGAYDGSSDSFLLVSERLRGQKGSQGDPGERGPPGREVSGARLDAKPQHSAPFLLSGLAEGSCSRLSMGVLGEGSQPSQGWLWQRGLCFVGLLRLPW